MKWMFFLCLICVPIFAEEAFKIGSKRFTESYLLGEIIKQVAEQADEAEVIYKSGLGNTEVAFAALQNGSIDVYPEYTGTIVQEFLKLSPDQKLDLTTLNSKLQPMGIGAHISLGFRNSYALAISQEEAHLLNILRISDLKKYPKLKLGLSQEFLKRKDGWEGLKKAYQLPQKNVTGIDHSLSYEALKNKQIDLTDIYNTDPKIEKYQMKVLNDDLQFFPAYDAILLYRLEVPQKFHQIWNALHSLKDSISTEEMLKMNEEAELQGESFDHIAHKFMVNKGIVTNVLDKKASLLESLWPLIKQHLFLVFGSLIPAILVGIPLGILAAYSTYFRHIILNFVAIIQTIPALAFFAFQAVLR